MDNILESLRELYEDRNEYPKKCKSSAYKILTDPHNLVLGSFVTSRRLTFPELGFNINQPYYGAGAMIKTTQALLFLTKEDANRFANKYGLDIEEIYLGKNFDTIVRIDANSDIPVYMQQSAITSDIKSKMQPSQLANLDATEGSVDGVASDEIIQANAKHVNQNNINNSIEALSNKLIEDIHEKHLDDVVISTDLGDFNIKYHGWLAGTRAFRMQVKVKAVNGGIFKKSSNGWHDTVLVESPQYDSSVQKSIIEPLEKEIPNKFKFNFHAYNNALPGELFYLDIYNRKIEFGLHTYTDSEANLYMKDINFTSWLKLSENEAKQKFENLIIDFTNKIKEDCNEAAKLKVYLEKVVDDIENDEAIEVSYDDFQK